MFVTTVTAGAGATPAFPPGVVPDSIAPFQTLVIIASASSYMGDSKVSATNGIPLPVAGTNQALVIPANHMQYASDLSEIYVIGPAKVTFMVFP